MNRESIENDIQDLIQHFTTEVQYSTLLYLLALTFSNLIGTSFAAFIMALPYPFVEHNNVPSLFYDDNDRSFLGTVTPRLAMTIAVTMMMAVAFFLMYAAYFHEPRALLGIFSYALYCAGIIFVRQIRFIFQQNRP